MAARNIVNHMYFDESIHQRGGFILGAYIFGPSAESRVSEALDKCGLRPNVDEYKSSMRMADHPEQLALRSELRLVRHGLYIAQSCSEDLRKAAVQRFGQCYMGCIH
jgi:hypothetical protein